jgi:hypothetical protein
VFVIYLIILCPRLIIIPVMANVYPKRSRSQYLF